MTKELNIYETQERAADARALLGSEIFHRSLAKLQEEYLQQLIQAEVGGLTAATAHASMKALEAIKAQLQAFITDEEMLIRKARR
jgi:hypothetical protein